MKRKLLSTGLLLIMAIGTLFVRADDLPDRPGANRVERDNPQGKKNRALRSLTKFVVKLSRDPKHSRSKNAWFALENEPGSVLGKVELVSLDASKKNPNLVLFLHGQEHERVKLAPGRYRLRLYFWRVDQDFPALYPHQTSFEVRRGMRAMLSITKKDYRAIKKWLKVFNSNKEIK